MSRVNDAPVSASNPFPQYIVVKDINTGQYVEVDSNTPLKVVLDAASPVSGQTNISIDDGAGNPVTISRSIVDPGAIKVEVINNSVGSNNIIEFDDGAGNPVTIAHVLGIQTVDLNNKHVIQSLDGATPIDSIGNVPKSLVQFIDPTTGAPFGVKNVNGKQRVTASPYYTEIAMGNILNHHDYNINAFKLIVPTIKTLATNLLLPVLPTVAVAAPVSVVSTSALDGILGTGVQQVELHGLDALGNDISEIIIMNGITPVLSLNSYATLNLAHATVCGALQNGAAGTITFSIGLAIVQQIDITDTRTATAYYKVPAGKKAVITQVLAAASNRGLGVYVEATVDPTAKTLTNCFVESKQIISDRGTTSYEFSFPIFLPAGAEVRIRWADTQLKGIESSVGFEMLLENI